MTTDSGIPNQLRAKEDELERILREMGSVVIAFSGGVDSTFLAFKASRVLGDKALAATATSSTYPTREFEEAKAYAGTLGIHHLIIESEELDIEGFSANTTDRCYHCKMELFSKLNRVASERGCLWVLDGSNADDVHDYRPGLKAARQLRVRSPLMEAGITKQEVRELSRKYDLPTWDKPAAACLSSRFPYGTAITAERLVMVEKGEEALRALGFRQFRLRFHGEIARIEIAPQELERALSTEMAGKMIDSIKPLGFTYVTLDLEGYRTGSLNEPLADEDKR